MHSVFDTCDMGSYSWKVVFTYISPRLIKPPFHREQDRWKTMKMAWSFNGLSMNFQWSLRSFMIPDWSFSGLRGLSGLQNFLKWFKMVFQRSFRGLTRKWSFSGLSAVFQRSLNELSKVLLVFPWSFDSLSIIFVEITQRPLRDLSRFIGRPVKDMHGDRWKITCSIKDLWKIAVGLV